MQYLRNIPTKKACIHTVIIDNYHPEMCNITVPNLRSYADKIGADFNIISTAKFDDYPPNYERFQVYEMGKEYKFNMVIDADFIIHPKVPDFTTYFDIKSVGSLWGIDLKFYFKWNNYFEKDGRNQGVADGIVVSTYLTHDIWTPCPYSFNEIRNECLKDERQVSEFWLSVNLARYGFKFTPIFFDHSGIYSPMATTNKLERPEELIQKKLNLWRRNK